MAFTITFQGTRVNDSDANTNWTKLNVGGGAPAAEGANVYQGAAIVGNTIKTAIGGIQYNPAAGAVDMTLSTRQLWFVKCVITDYADLVVTLGARITLGSSSTLTYQYVVAGTDANRTRFNAWPSQGGYLIFGLNPNISSWIEVDNSPDLTAIDYFAFEVDTQNGFAKSENMGLDAIDIGTGLRLIGTSPVTDGFRAFAIWDQDDTTARYGVVLQPAGEGGPITVNGRLEIGDGTNETDFSSDAEYLIYPDGYHGEGDLGVSASLEVANSSYTDTSTHISLGSASVEDTRPDYVFIGNVSPANVSHTLTNFNKVIYSSTVTASAATIGCTRLEQSGSSISNCTIRTDSVTDEACVPDSTFGTTTGINNTDFIWRRGGHAVTIPTAGSYTFTGLTFTNYGGNGSPSASVDVLAASGEVTISVDGGDSPTYKSAGASVLVSNPIIFTLTGIASGSEVRLISNSIELAGQESIDTAENFVYNYNYPGYTQLVDVVVHALDYEYVLLRNIELSNANSSVPISQTLDRNYSNPI